MSLKQIGAIVLVGCFCVSLKAAERGAPVSPQAVQPTGWSVDGRSDHSSFSKLVALYGVLGAATLATRGRVPRPGAFKFRPRG